MVGSLSYLDGYDFLDRLWQKYIKPINRRQRYSQYILLALLLIGVFHPTSWQTDISVFFRRSSIYILNLLFFVLLLLNGLGDRVAYRCGLAIPFILFSATFFSPLKDIAIGAYVSFLPISLLFCVNLRNIPWSRLFPVCFSAVNVVVIVCAVTVIFNIQLVERLFLNIYSAFYINLLKNMLYLGKPVLFFASHSIAACIYILIFYLNLKIFLHYKVPVYLFFALSYIVFMFLLKSTASYSTFILSILIVSCYLSAPFFQYEKRKIALFALFFVGLMFLLVYFFGNDFFISVKSRLVQPGSGFLGRYSPTGVLAGNIQYILENPFSPVGLRNSRQFWFMDSGIVEYMLRGSVFLVLAIYYSLFRFLRFHLPSRATYWLVFIIVFINELGFPYLKYFRFMYLFPFIIVYLRHLELEFPLEKAQG